jgi:hypothetical protein
LAPNFPVEFVLYNLPVDDRLAAPVFPVPPVNGGAILGHGSDGIVLSRAA